MERRRFASSSVRAVGYDAESRVLEVEFLKRGTFRYFDVPPMIGEGLLASPSKGRFFNDRVLGRYRFEELKS